MIENPLSSANSNNVHEVGGGEGANCNGISYLFDQKMLKGKMSNVLRESKNVHKELPRMAEGKSNCHFCKYYDGKKNVL